VVTVRLKRILSSVTSFEYFGYLETRQIHKAIGVAQEGLHIIEMNNMSSMVIKLDLSKAYDRTY
jgi:hypothetical protein